MNRLPSAPSEGEALLALQLRCERIPFDREFLAVPDRKFRWDFFIAPDLLVEVQGGAWSRGKSGHNGGSGLQRDAEKSAMAAIHGYRQISATTEQVKEGSAIGWIKQAIRRAA